MCFCLKICLSVKQLRQNICFHIHPLKFGMHYHFASEKLITNFCVQIQKLKSHYFELALIVMFQMFKCARMFFSPVILIKLLL